MILPFMTLFSLVISVILKWDCIYTWVRKSSNNTLDSNNIQKSKLLVGILSAQSNFRARQAIRETWAQLSVNRSIDVMFLVGEEGCPYPVEDRVTPYSCELWLINAPKVLDEYSTAGGSISSTECVTGFTFLIKTDIEVKRLGLDYSAFSNFKFPKARVVLYNSITGEKVASATFIKESVAGFIWKPVKPVVLEKGFEGEIKLYDVDVVTSHCSILLQYIAPVYYFETLDYRGQYHPFELENFTSSLVGMNYSLRGATGLDRLLLERIERFTNWTLKMNLLKLQLEDEHKKYNDILFLGGFPDVYNNLSFKVALFLDWAKKMNKWLYILKTDDDVFLNLRLIEKGLNGSFDLWSCMKKQSPNLAGKWRDRISTGYPSFPSGSGYVISMKAMNRFHVKPRYKLGEDVMIGIGFEGAQQPSEQVCFWACGSMLYENIQYCNAPELNPTHLRKIWKIYNESGYIPSNEKYI